ncbi:MAG: cbb3-type cytochrome c oxidase subunit I [Verrucomicrobiales bacterium]
MSQDSSTAPIERPTPEDVRERAELDRSTKMPVLFLLTSGLVWLLVSCLLGLFASFKLHTPGFLDFNCLNWLNWGRLQPAAYNSLVYGWCFQAAMAVGLWLMARLCRQPLRNPVTVVVAGHFWNLGVLIGVGNILLGAQSPGELLEFGRSAWLMLFAAFVLIVVWPVMMFATRPKGADYVTQWYVLGATFWFAWLFLTVNLFASPQTPSGLHAALTASWYGNGVLFLFLVPMAVGTAYYLIPKIVGRPLHSYHLAVAGFWSLALFGGWTGLQKLIGGPLPTWMPAVSSAAQVMLLIPVICVAANHFLTTRGQHGLVQVSPTLRFVFAGAVFYVASHVVAAFFALAPSLSQYTAAWDGLRFMLVYSYFSMTMFGAIYFILPRLTGCEWLSPQMIRIHFWANVYGGSPIGVFLIIGGFFQANALNVWSNGFGALSDMLSGAYMAATLGWAFILFANTVFFFHFVLIALRLGRRSERATLLSGPAHYDHAQVVITTEGAEA